MNNPFFSIVIPTYNRATFLPKVIESFLNQTFQDFELIIVDDGSTDNTEEVVAPYLSERVHYYKKENAERAAARNFGTQKAKGKYINWFDSDDYALDFFLEEAYELIKKHPLIKAFHLGFQIEDEKGKVLEVFNQNHSINKNLYRGNTLACNGVLLEREIALKNPFNETRKLSASEDFELWLRIATQFQFKNSKRICSVMINHDNRSVKMENHQKLIDRYLSFIEIVSNNDAIKKYYLGKFKILIVKNYLWLAVDLAFNKHKKESIKYLKISIKYSFFTIFQKSFYATIKHLIRN